MLPAAWATRSICSKHPKGREQRREDKAVAHQVEPETEHGLGAVVMLMVMQRAAAGVRQRVHQDIHRSHALMHQRVALVFYTSDLGGRYVVVDVSIISPRYEGHDHPKKSDQRECPHGPDQGQ